MIWEACQGESHIGLIQGLLYRLVESQQQIATLSFVDSLDEQALLEEMLERAKPDNVAETDDLHYLLRTPFRYPPLKWGSRFGQVHEPGLFYGSRSVAVTLSEAAFYRFFFWRSMSSPPIKPSIRTQHSLFSARYKTANGVRLQRDPFTRFREALIDPRSYTACQSLGTSMREAGVEAFEYASARHREHGTCVAAFSPRFFSSRRPLSLQAWLCELSAEEVAFKQIGASDVSRFRCSDFLVDGEFPSPA